MKRRRRLRSASSRSLRFRVVGSLLVLGAFLVLAEIVAGAAGSMVPEWQAPDNPGVLMNGHPTRLWGMGEGKRPNVGAMATIGANGLRDPMPELPRPGGRSRVLVVGDSTFFGHGVHDDETIPALLAAELLARGLDADAANGAIPGYSTEQTRILLEEVGWATEPTLLLIGSLWSDNNVDGFRDADLLRTARLYRENPLGRSAFFRLLVTQVDRLRGGDGARMVTWTKESTWPEGHERRVPLRDYAANLDTMAREARARGIGVAFIAPVNRALLDDAALRTAGWDPYFAAQKAVAAWHAVPLVSSKVALAGEGVPSVDLFVDRMHPSPMGARAIARAVASELLAAGWPGNPLLGRAEPFDTSGLNDSAATLSGGAGLTRSPQSQLFPGLLPVTESAPVADPGARAAPMIAGWEVKGVVTAGSAPVDLAVEASDGRTLAVFRVALPGPFAIPIHGGDAKVKVIASGEDAQLLILRAEQGGPALTVTFPR